MLAQRGPVQLRECLRVAPAFTRSGAQRAGVRGALALLAEEEDIAGILAQPAEALLCDLEEFAAGPADIVRPSECWSVAVATDRSGTYGASCAIFVGARLGFVSEFVGRM